MKPEIDSTDERLGLPSASAMQRIFSCPASLALTNRLRAKGKLPTDHGNKYASHGTEIHAILEKMATSQDVSACDPDQITEAEELWEKAQSVTMAVFGIPIEDCEVDVENRLWLVDEKPVASGRFDLVIKSEDKALVIDYKTGHGNVPQAEENLQLVAAAVLLREQGDYPEVHGCVIQTGRKPSRAQFSKATTDRFKEVMLDHFAKSEVVHPLEFGFNPTDDNCKYCPCRLHCPRLVEDVAEIVTLAAGGSESFGLIAYAPTPVLSDFLLKCETVTRLEKAAMAEMEARLAAGETDDNWHIAASSPRRVVTDARAMAKTLIAQGASTEAVIAAMTMTVGTAEKLLGTVCAWKGAKLKSHLADLAGNSIGLSDPKPTLKRK